MTFTLTCVYSYYRVTFLGTFFHGWLWLKLIMLFFRQHNLNFWIRIIYHRVKISKSFYGFHLIDLFLWVLAYFITWYSGLCISFYSFSFESFLSSLWNYKLVLSSFNLFVSHTFCVRKLKISSWFYSNFMR